uniref:Lipoprotein n=1 Tax=Desulfovibrio sp. U5L TaxID=596152 RepID=I2PYF3_9BACT
MFRAVCALFVLAVLALCGCAHTSPLASNLEVRTTGDAQVYGVYSSSPLGSDRR